MKPSHAGAGWVPVAQLHASLRWNDKKTRGHTRRRKSAFGEIETIRTSWQVVACEVRRPDSHCPHHSSRLFIFTCQLLDKESLWLQVLP
jgi:hypothetical protein